MSKEEPRGQGLSKLLLHHLERVDYILSIYKAMGEQVYEPYARLHRATLNNKAALEADNEARRTSPKG